MSYVVLQLTPEQAAGLLALAEHGRLDPVYESISLANLAGHDAGLALLQLAVDRQQEAALIARRNKLRENMRQPRTSGFVFPRLTERHAKALLACADTATEADAAVARPDDAFVQATRGGAASLRLALQVAGFVD